MGTFYSYTLSPSGLPVYILADTALYNQLNVTGTPSPIYSALHVDPNTTEYHMRAAMTTLSMSSFPVRYYNELDETYFQHYLKVSAFLSAIARVWTTYSDVPSSTQYLGDYSVGNYNPSNTVTQSGFAKVPSRNTNFVRADSRIIWWSTPNNSSGGTYVYISVVPESAIVNGKIVASELSNYDIIISFSVTCFVEDDLIDSVSVYVGMEGRYSTTAAVHALLDGVELEKYETNTDPFTPNPSGSGGPTGPSMGGDGTGGGSGDFDYHSDNVGASETPTISASDSGMLTIHCGDISYLQALSAYLWAGAFDPNNWKKLFADPMDCILGCHMIPFQPVTHAGVITVGNISTGVAMPVANNQFQSRDCGSINITSQSLSHSFMDFLPYLKCSLYLPFIGIVPINSDDVIDKTLHIKYICDILSGTVLAQVESNGNLVYQYSGNFATEIPITAGQFANGYQTLLKAGQIAMGGFVNAVGASQSAQKAPNAIGAAAAIVGGVVETNNTINDLATNIVASLKPVITRSGGISGTSGFMAQKYPYVIVEAPNLAVPKSQNYYTGYMQYETINLGSISGYTEILATHLDGITATNDEKAEIMNMLKSGVML